MDMLTEDYLSSILLLIWTPFIGQLDQSVGWEGMSKRWMWSIVILASCEYCCIKVHKKNLVEYPRNNISIDIALKNLCNR